MAKLSKANQQLMEDFKERERREAAGEMAIELAKEVAEHLYEKQDIQRCRELAQAVIDKLGE